LPDHAGKVNGKGSIKPRPLFACQGKRLQAACGGSPLGEKFMVRAFFGFIGRMGFEFVDVLKIVEDSFSRINLAGIFYNKGNHDEAFRQLETAADKNPDSAHPLSVLGEFKEREGKLAEAEQNYLKALSIDNQHAPTHYRLGRLHLKREKFVKGIEHLKQASDLEAENPAYLETLGAEYERSGDYLETVNFYERVSVLEPDRLDIYVKLGDLYKKKTMFREALSRYWSALALKNDDPYIHRSVLEIYKILSEHEKEQLKTLEGQNSFARNP